MIERDWPITHSLGVATLTPTTVADAFDHLSAVVRIPPGAYIVATVHVCVPAGTLVNRCEVPLTVTPTFVPGPPIT